MKRTIIAFVFVVAFLAARIHAVEPADKKASEQKTEAKADGSKPGDQTSVTNLASVTNQTSVTNKLPPGKAFAPLPNTNTVKLTNLIMKASYTIGVRMAVNVMMDGAELIDREMVLLGMRDVLFRYMPMIEQDEAEEASKKFEKMVQEHEAQKVKQEAVDNLNNGIAFLAENKKKEGIKVSDSGLQYKVVQEGKGESPTMEDTVAIHFRARNIEGIEFSNSLKHKEPVPVPVRSQIKAWREALLMMKPGAKMELFVPSELAYGNREVGKGVGPNSTLIFDLELVRIVKESEKPAPKK